MPGRARLPAQGAVRHRAGGAAAQGYPRVALGTMLDEVLGFRLAKEHSAADWSIRPLPTEMLSSTRRSMRGDSSPSCARRPRRTAARGRGEDRVGQAGVRRVARGPAGAAAHRSLAAYLRHPQGARTRAFAFAVVRELWQERDEVAREADLSPLPGCSPTRRSSRRPGPRRARRRRSAARNSTGSTASTRATPASTRPAGRRRCCGPANSTRATCPRWRAPTATGGPPPARDRWAERDPAAAARLAAGRETVTALATANRLLLAENLLPGRAAAVASRPGSRRRPRPRRRSPRDSWTGFGARPWQAGADAAGPPGRKAFAATTEAAAG